MCIYLLEKCTGRTDLQYVPWTETLIWPNAWQCFTHLSGGVPAVPVSDLSWSSPDQMIPAFISGSRESPWKDIGIWFQSCFVSTSQHETYRWFIIADSIIPHSFSSRSLSPVYYPFLIYSSPTLICPVGLLHFPTHPFYYSISLFNLKLTYVAISPLYLSPPPPSIVNTSLVPMIPCVQGVIAFVRLQHWHGVAMTALVGRLAG